MSQRYDDWISFETKTDKVVIKGVYPTKTKIIMEHFAALGVQRVQGCYHNVKCFLRSLVDVCGHASR